MPHLQEGLTAESAEDAESEGDHKSLLPRSQRTLRVHILADLAVGEILDFGDCGV